MSTCNLYFEQKCEKYQSFLSETFQFLKVKFSINLNRCVFVMRRETKSFSAKNIRFRKMATKSSSLSIPLNFNGTGMETDSEFLFYLDDFSPTLAWLFYLIFFQLRKQVG